MKKRVKLDVRHFIVNGNEPALLTIDDMKLQFWESILKWWFIAAIRAGIPKDIRRLVVSMIPVNYILNPIWEFIEDHKHKNHHLTVLYYGNKRPLYNAEDDPYATKVSKKCFRHHNLIVSFHSLDHDEDRIMMHKDYQMLVDVDNYSDTITAQYLFGELWKYPEMEKLT
jgi:hypothetical protein